MHVYMYGCVCVDLCVLWVAGGIISCIYEVALKCLEDLLLSILAQRPPKELCLHEPVRLEERTKDIRN